jgi:hypothetical protein
MFLCRLNRCAARMLDVPTGARLRQQFLAPAWDLDPAGRRLVEPKEVTREKIGRSPDDADAANLAFHDGEGDPSATAWPSWRPAAPPGWPKAARGNCCG